MRSGRGGAHGPCWRGDPEGPWVLVALGWCAWGGGDPGDDVACVALFVALVSRILGAVSSVAGGEVPVHFKVVVSEEYEVVDEERPPRIERSR